jgi:putative oxidoreductase
MDNLSTVWTPRILSLLRIVAGVCFFEHGTSKLFGMPHNAMWDSLQLFSLMGLAGTLEVVGGFLVAIGLFTRVAAFILSGEMAFAYFMAHAPKSPFPVMNGGDAAILYSFLFLYIAFAGGGEWAVDALRKRSHVHVSAPA